VALPVVGPAAGLVTPESAQDIPDPRSKATNTAACRINWITNTLGKKLPELRELAADSLEKEVSDIDIKQLYNFLTSTNEGQNALQYTQNVFEFTCKKHEDVPLECIKAAYLSWGNAKPPARNKKSYDAWYTEEAVAGRELKTSFAKMFLQLWWPDEELPSLKEVNKEKPEPTEIDAMRAHMNKTFTPEQASERLSEIQAATRVAPTKGQRPAKVFVTLLAEISRTPGNANPFSSKQAEELGKAYVDTNWGPNQENKPKGEHLTDKLQEEFKAGGGERAKQNRKNRLSKAHPYKVQAADATKAPDAIQALIEAPHTNIITLN